jgi:hypothetical protein
MSFWLGRLTSRLYYRPLIAGKKLATVPLRGSRDSNLGVLGFGSTPFGISRAGGDGRFEGYHCL